MPVPPGKFAIECRCGYVMTGPIAPHAAHCVFTCHCGMRLDLSTTEPPKPLTRSCYICGVMVAGLDPCWNAHNEGYDDSDDHDYYSDPEPNPACNFNETSEEDDPF